MSKTDIEEDLTPNEFKQLLQDEEFLEFFNKFTCLPAFSQLVVYSKSRQEFLFEPSFQSDQFILNKRGLLQWLWKRCNLFVKTRLYVEYCLAKRLVNCPIFHTVHEDLSKSDEQVILASLSRLSKRCFGKVSGLRKFRRFLLRTKDGYKMYQFWLRAERLYEYIKRKSVACVERLNQLKETFYSESGEFALPRHIMDSAWRLLPEEYRLSQTDSTSRVYGITFTTCMQKLCLDRLCTYWIPRYLFSCDIQTRSSLDGDHCSLALSYLRRNMPDNFHISGLQSYDGVLPPCSALARTISDKFEDVDYEAKSDHSTQNNKHTNPSTLSYAGHAPSGSSSGDSEEESRSGRSDEEDKLSESSIIFEEKSENFDESEGNGSKIRSAVSKTENDVRKSGSKVSKASSETQKFKERKLARKKNKSSKKMSDSSSDDWASSSSAETKTSSRSKRSKRSKRSRRKSDQHRAQRFQEVLLNTSLSESLKKSIISMKQLPENRRKQSADEQLIIDNTQSADDLPCPVESEWDVVDERKLSEGRTEVTDIDNAGGKTLLKTLLRLPNDQSPPATRGDQEGYLGSTTSYWEMNKDENDYKNQLGRSAAKIGQELLIPRVVTPKNYGRRLHRKDSHDSGLSATAVPKKRRPSFRAKVKKTKVTTLTFTLSGETEKKRKKQTSYMNVKLSDKPRQRKNAQEDGLPLKKATSAQPMKKKKTKKPSSARTETAPHVFTVHEDFQYRKVPENQRMIVALQTDHAAGSPFEQFLVNTDNEEMIDFLNFWQDVEKSRVDYEFGNMNFANFTKSLASIVTNYLLPNSTYDINAPSSITKVIMNEIFSSDVFEMPWELRKLQLDVFEELKPSFQAYFAQDIQTFHNMATLRIEDYSVDHLARKGRGEHRTRRRRSSRTQLPPIQSRDKLLSGYLSFKTEETPQSREMRAKMHRAQKIVIEGHLPSGRTDVEGSEESSDDDGNMKTPPPPIVVRKPPVDMKVLAAMSVVEYPNDNQTCRLVAFREKRVQRVSASYYKPIKKGGQILRRPMNRPITFNEVLKDVVHLEFFKRYLKAHHSDIPIHFWCAVEGLRSTNNTKKRQKKAKQIIKRFFHSNKGPATKIMRCQADVIKEIPYLDLVTTGMLFVAQTAVAKSLEVDWFRKYAATFPDVIVVKASEITEDTTTSNIPSKLTAVNLKGPWAVFGSFIKRAAMFLHHMRDPKFMNLFLEFLKQEAEDNDTDHPADESLTTDLKAKRSGLLPNLYMEAEREKRKFKQKIINRQLITFNFLENDFKFWQEIQRFKQMADCCCSIHETRGGNRSEEVRMLKRKAHLIVRCYLDSSISPEIRVNVPAEVCEITIESLQNGMLDRTLFHEATIYIFPLLVTFWKRFCDVRYKYVPELSKKQLKIYGNKNHPVVALLMAKKAQEERKERKKRKTPSATPKKSFNSGDYFPDYHQITTENFKKLRGDDAGSRITFSVRLGPCLIQSGKGRKSTVIKTESPDVRFVMESAPSTAGGENRTSSRAPSSATTPIPTTKKVFVDISTLNEITPGLTIQSK